MPRLYLVCAICDRRQAEGLISGAAWKRLELPTGTAIEHPAVKGSTLLTCPSCAGNDPAWAERALGRIGLKADAA
jgi:hypothetical protein